MNPNLRQNAKDPHDDTLFRPLLGNKNLFHTNFTKEDQHEEREKNYCHLYSERIKINFMSLFMRIFEYFIYKAHCQWNFMETIIKTK